ncbi:hypothetical protein Agabi119p4_9050 [Agaricus bisporus var. burnettii]|uniref:Uncharacterized protein n=1 Tax=Agaricus bisporus var. burnettii TaxID=192524 RepID=A0A8H7C565_AGABI|nr:hypothetical protein Agabi119p4_9050 [Agaricus bisporus var. burnettii]
MDLVVFSPCQTPAPSHATITATLFHTTSLISAEAENTLICNSLRLIAVSIAAFAGNLRSCIRLRDNFDLAGIQTIFSTNVPQYCLRLVDVTVDTVPSIIHISLRATSMVPFSHSRKRSNAHNWLISSLPSPYNSHPNPIKLRTLPSTFHFSAKKKNGGGSVIPPSNLEFFPPALPRVFLSSLTHRAHFTDIYPHPFSASDYPYQVADCSRVSGLCLQSDLLPPLKKFTCFHTTPGQLDYIGLTTDFLTIEDPWNQIITIVVVQWVYNKLGI